MSNEYFDKRAAAWDDNPARNRRSQIIADFICEKVPLNTQFTVLDYGCGTGVLSLILADKVASVCAADISDGMLTEVRKKAVAGNIKNVRAVNFDITKDQPLNKKYDLVVSAMAMHHIEKPFEVITKLAGLINPGGWIAIADLCEEDGSFHEEGVAMHNGFRPEDIAEYLKNLKMTCLEYKNVFDIEKNSRNYPVFCMCARKI